MHRTLDSLLQDIQHKKKQSTSLKTGLSFSLPTWLQEVKILLTIFIVMFLGMLVFTNANLFVHALGLVQHSYDAQSLAVVEQVQIAANQPVHIDTTVLQKYADRVVAQDPIALDVATVLENRLPYYGFDFNTLPPVDRLVIDGIALDVPLISVTNKSEGDFVNGDFDLELRDGVVKYPTTPMPGEGGNTLVFGHTSQEWREKNPYGTVFSNLPKLQHGDEIKLVRKGELYTYRVVETVVRWPKDVDTEFQKRQAKDKEYITLMGCYPLGTTKQRMMVMAERVY